MTHVWLVCSEPIRPHMAGIGIRYIEMARALRDTGFEVTLSAPIVDETAFADAEKLRLCGYTAGHRGQFAGAQALVVQGHLALDVLACRGNIPVVIDLYDPYLIENMAYSETLGPQVYLRDHESWRTQLSQGDFFLCASDVQRDYYLGFLTALGRLNPASTKNDPSLRQLIDTVSFGIPHQIPDYRAYLPPRKSGRYRLLFGGLYDWYDPWTLLKALDSAEFEHCCVIFVRNPNPESTPQNLFGEVRDWCDARGWGEDRVLFIDWVPWNRRFDLLRDVNVLIAPHVDSLETHFSMRTRFVESIAVGCPVVTSAGGAMDGMVREYKAGRVVTPQDVAGMREALRSYTTELSRIDDRHRSRFVKDHDWEKMIVPLVDFCRSPRRMEIPQPFNTLDTLTGVATEGGPRFLFSIIIPSYNRMDVLPDVIDALHNQYAPPNFELIVIDDGSSDGTLTWLKNHHFTIPVQILSQPNRGPAAARNKAIRAASGDYIVFLGDDMVPDRFWLKTHCDAHARRGYEQRLVIIGQTDWHENVKRSAFLKFLDKTGWQFGFDQISDPDDVDFNFFYGSNLSLRRQWLLENLFNTEFPFPAWEDIELGYRLKLIDLHFVFEPAARTAHLHHTNLVRMAQRQRKTGYSAVVFCRLHPELESFLWPSTNSLRRASGPVMGSARKWLAAALERFPIELPKTWNNILRDHYVRGIRQYLNDHGVKDSDPASILPNQLYPIVFLARSPLLKHNCGTPCKDGWRCVFETDKRGHCIYGPYLRMHKEQPLEIRFYLGVQDVTPDKQTAVTLDVYDAENDQVLSSTSVKAGDIEHSEYQALSFVAESKQNLEFRAYWHGSHTLDVQRLELHINHNQETNSAA